MKNKGAQTLPFFPHTLVWVQKQEDSEADQMQLETELVHPDPKIT